MAFQDKVEDHLAQERSKRQRKFEDQCDQAVFLINCRVGIVKTCKQDNENVIKYQISCKGAKPKYLV